MPDETPPVVLPDHFVGPNSTPTFVESFPIHDDRGQGWVGVRYETIHGSFVSFLTPDAAQHHANNLADSIPKARADAIVVPTST